MGHHQSQRGGALGGSFFGGAMPGKIYGTGGGGNPLSEGLLPGHHVVDHKQVQRALHNYKLLHGLGNYRGQDQVFFHGKPHRVHLPPEHIFQIMKSHLEAPAHKGGFLPLALAGLLPLLGTVAGHFLGGATSRVGNIAADKILGRGMPKAVRLNDGTLHWHVHGDGFKDFLKRVWGHASNIFKSEPARKIGHYATKSLLDAVANAAAGKIDEKIKDPTFNAMAKEAADYAKHAAGKKVEQVFEGHGMPQEPSQMLDHMDDGFSQYPGDALAGTTSGGGMLGHPGGYGALTPGGFGSRYMTDKHYVPRNITAGSGMKRGRKRGPQKKSSVKKQQSKKSKMCLDDVY